MSELRDARVTNSVTARAIVMCARDSLGPDASSEEVGQLAMRLVTRAADALKADAEAALKGGKQLGTSEDEVAFGVAMIMSMADKLRAGR